MCRVWCVWQVSLAVPDHGSTLCGVWFHLGESRWHNSSDFGLVLPLPTEWELRHPLSPWCNRLASSHAPTPLSFPPLPQPPPAPQPPPMLPGRALRGCVRCTWKSRFCRSSCGRSRRTFGFNLLDFPCFFVPVGFKGNLSLLEILYFSRGLKQMAADRRDSTLCIPIGLAWFLAATRNTESQNKIQETNTRHRVETDTTSFWFRSV